MVKMHQEKIRFSCTLRRAAEIAFTEKESPPENILLYIIIVFNSNKVSCNSAATRINSKSPKDFNGVGRNAAVNKNSCDCKLKNQERKHLLRLVGIA